MSRGNDRVTCFLNAWWGSPTASWPPPSNINPIMLSIHIAQGMKASGQNILTTSRNKHHLDVVTMTLLISLEHGIEAYFSGCLTLLINNPNVRRKRTENIYLVDVKSEFTKFLQLEVQEKAVTVTHNMMGTNKYDSLARFTTAYQLMEMYASAKLVVTQRIHYAFPWEHQLSSSILLQCLGEEELKQRVPHVLLD